MHKSFLRAAGLALLLVGCSQDVRAAENLVLRANKALPLCQELEQILNLPENRGYITADINLTEATREKFGHQLFYIPKDRKNFSTSIDWQPSSEEEFRKSASQQYQKLKESRTDPLPHLHVEKRLMDVANIGDPRMIYKIDIEGYSHHQFYMEERKTDPISEGFNKHIRGSEVFYYKGRVYISSTSHTGGLGIDEPTFVRSIQQMGFVQVCLFNVE